MGRNLTQTTEAINIALIIMVPGTNKQSALMQGRWPDQSSLPSWPMHGSLDWWAWGHPTTTAQNLAELLLTTCGCRYVIAMGARFKSSLWTWHFGADGQRPRRRLVQHSRHPTNTPLITFLNDPVRPASPCWGAFFLYLELGSPIESKAVGTVVTTRTTAMLVL